MSGWWAMPTPSPRIICAGPARYLAVPLPTTGCSKSSCRWFTAASSTRFVSPTRRLRSSRLSTGVTNWFDPKAKRTAKRTHASRHRPYHDDIRSPGESLGCRQRRGARQGDGIRHHVVRGRRNRSASAHCLRVDLSARTRRLQRSGQGWIYRAVESAEESNEATFGFSNVCCCESQTRVKSDEGSSFRDNDERAAYCSDVRWTIWRPPFSSLSLLTYSSGRSQRTGTFSPIKSAMSPINAVQLDTSALQTGELACNFLM